MKGDYCLYKHTPWDGDEAASDDSGDSEQANLSEEEFQNVEDESASVIIFVWCYVASSKHDYRKSLESAYASGTVVGASENPTSVSMRMKTCSTLALVIIGKYLHIRKCYLYQAKKLNLDHS